MPSIDSYLRHSYPVRMQAVSQALAAEADSGGLPVRRRKFQYPVWLVQLTTFQATAAAAATFEAFVRDTLLDGLVAFTWTHPITGAFYQCALDPTSPFVVRQVARDYWEFDVSFLATGWTLAVADLLQAQAVQALELTAPYSETFVGTGNLEDHTSDSGHTYSQSAIDSTLSGGELHGTGGNAVAQPIGATTHGKTYTVTVGAVVTNCNFRLARSATSGGDYPASAADTFYELYFRGLFGDYKLTKYVAGTPTELINAANTVSAGDVYTWHLSAAGVHTIEKNGGALGSYDEGGTPLDGTYIGVRMTTDAASGITSLSYQ